MIILFLFLFYLFVIKKYNLLFSFLCFAILQIDIFVCTQKITSGIFLHVNYNRAQQAKWHFKQESLYFTTDVEISVHQNKASDIIYNDTKFYICKTALAIAVFRFAIIKQPVIKLQLLTLRAFSTLFVILTIACTCMKFFSENLQHKKYEC